MSDIDYFKDPSTPAKHPDGVWITPAPVSVAETHKYVPKAPITPNAVASRVIAQLLTNDPMSVAELSRLLPDINKDSIQHVLDAFNALGIIMPVRQTSSSAAARSSSSMHGDESSSSVKISASFPVAASIQYCFTGFTKCVEAVDFDMIDEVIAETKKRTDMIRTRNKILKHLSDGDYSKEMRTAELVRVISDFINEDASLIDDALYQDILKHLGQESAAIIRQTDS